MNCFPSGIPMLFCQSSCHASSSWKPSLAYRHLWALQTLDLSTEHSWHMTVILGCARQASDMTAQATTKTMN